MKKVKHVVVDEPPEAPLLKKIDIMWQRCQGVIAKHTKISVDAVVVAAPGFVKHHRGKGAFLSLTRTKDKDGS